MAIKVIAQGSEVKLGKKLFDQYFVVWQIVCNFVPDFKNDKLCQW